MKVSPHGSNTLNSISLFLLTIYYFCVRLPFVSSSSSPSSGGGGGQYYNPYYAEQQRYGSYQVQPPSQEQPIVSEPPPLPEGWFEATDPATGYKYYYNKEKNITQWERPTADSTASLEDQGASSSSSNPSVEESVNVVSTTADELVAGHEDHHYQPALHVQQQDESVEEVSPGIKASDETADSAVDREDEQQGQQPQSSSAQPSLHHQQTATIDQHHQIQYDSTNSNLNLATKPSHVATIDTPAITGDSLTSDFLARQQQQYYEMQQQQQQQQKQQMPQPAGVAPPPSDTAAVNVAPRLPFGQPPFLPQNRNMLRQQHQLPAQQQQQQPQILPTKQQPQLPQSPLQQVVQQQHPQQPHQQHPKIQQQQQPPQQQQGLPQHPWQQSQQRQPPTSIQHGTQQYPHQLYQQQQQQHPYGGYYNVPQQQSAGGYSNYGQQQNNQLIQSSSAPGAVKEALGNAWQTVLGFGKKAQEVASSTSEKVVTGATMAGGTITSTSAGLWTKAKSSIEQVGKALFDEDSTTPQQQAQQGYSLSDYGVPPSGVLPGNRGTPQQQQQPGQVHPQQGSYYGQQQPPYFQAPQQQYQQRYGVAGVPPGVGIVPRGDAAYPHQHMPQQHGGTSSTLQHTQWGVKPPTSGAPVLPEAAAARQQQQVSLPQQQYYHPSYYGSDSGGRAQPPHQHPQQPQQYPPQQPQQQYSSQQQQQQQYSPQQQQQKKGNDAQSQDPWLIDDY
mmetsp:Transcript_5456/g.8049  ORF Transcript_5456/g.8049 Transcript_5456/m.8049 type:complete len:726 (-) Transcript_5456:241-2418(-)